MRELEHGAPAAALPARQPAPNAPTPPPGPADIADTRDAPCLLRLKPVPGQGVAPPADPSHIALNTVRCLTTGFDAKMRCFSAEGTPYALVAGCYTSASCYVRD